MDESKSAVAQPIFRDAVNYIAQSYVELGHQFGWVFLHTPASTLAQSTRLFLIALNPASNQRNPKPEESDEGGNAYRIRKWKTDRTSALQKQVCAFYKLLATKLANNWESLMDSSLAGNFCPFGSPSWTDLPEKPKSIEFSTNLWLRIMKYCAPSAIVCLGEVCYRCMSEAALASGYHSIRTTKSYTGWGYITYAVAEMDGSNRLLLVRLPHLSRYQIFQRSGRTDHFQPLMDKLVEYLK